MILLLYTVYQLFSKQNGLTVRGIFRGKYGFYAKSASSEGKGRFVGTGLQHAVPPAGASSDGDKQPAFLGRELMHRD
jgi:hypothetical protein